MTTRIRDILAAAREFTEYAEKTGGGGCWVLIDGTHGPTPVFAPDRDKWRTAGRIFSILQVLTVGWEEAHDCSLWNYKPEKKMIMEALELSEKHYTMIEAAAGCQKPYNVRLRTDLLAACGLEDSLEVRYRTQQDLVYY